MDRRQPTAAALATLALLGPSAERVVTAECEMISDTIVCRPEQPPLQDQHGREPVSRDAITQAMRVGSGAPQGNPLPIWTHAAVAMAMQEPIECRGSGASQAKRDRFMLLDSSRRANLKVADQT
jgi:hypothetical protein